ncbi:hypothetical protein BC833DRAFT_619300 [Globomyces pollinis-pini]|nr:hypothetical protein BC833DRAFT_619300 [Globomyces pollinis-pini]
MRNIITNEALIQNANLSLPEYKDALSASRLWKEFLLFERFLIKANNQHRKTHYFKKLILVKKILIKLKSLPFGTLIACPTQPNQNVKITESQNLEGIHHVMTHLVAGHLLMVKGNIAIIDAYVECRNLASQTFFMAVSLSFMGILSRLHFLLEELGTKVVEVYNLLYDRRADIFSNSFELNEMLMDDGSTWPYPLDRISIHSNTLSDIPKPKDKCQSLKVHTTVNDLSNIQSDAVPENHELSDSFWKTIENNKVGLTLPEKSIPKSKIDNVKKKIKPIKKKPSKTTKSVDDIDDIFGDF